jgi:hypothetical protein
MEDERARKPKLMPEKYWHEVEGLSRAYLADLVWECVKLDVEPPYNDEEVAVELRRWVNLTRLQRLKRSATFVGFGTENLDRT